MLAQKIHMKKLLLGAFNIYTFCVQIGQLFEAEWDFKLSEEFEIDVIFLWKQPFYRFQAFFKDSLCLQKLTNLDAKGAKRSVKMWTANFYQNFFKNTLLYMNGRPSKLRSVHTYVMPRTVYFDWICKSIDRHRVLEH